LIAELVKMTLPTWQDGTKSSGHEQTNNTTHSLNYKTNSPFQDIF